MPPVAITAGKGMVYIPGDSDVRQDWEGLDREVLCGCDFVGGFLTKD
jgi:hypothetical protein